MPREKQRLSSRKSMALAGSLLLIGILTAVFWLFSDQNPSFNRAAESGNSVPGAPEIPAGGNSGSRPVTSLSPSIPVEPTNPETVTNDGGASGHEGPASDFAPEGDGPLLTVDGEPLPAELARLGERTEAPEQSLLQDFSVTVSGKVSRPDGSPVQGANVYATGSFLSMAVAVGTRPGVAAKYHYRLRAGDTRVVLKPAVTDANGAYSLVVEGSELHDLESPNHRIHLSVRAVADGLVTSAYRGIQCWGKCVLPPEIPGVDLVLCKAGQVSGRVVQAAGGEPHAGARVSLHRPSMDFDKAFHFQRLGDSLTLERLLPPPVACVTAGVDGGFSFTGVADGVYHCWTVWPGMQFAEWRLHHTRPPENTPQWALVTVRDGEAVEGVELVLPRPARLLFRTDPMVDAAPGVLWQDQEYRRRPESTLNVPDDVLMAVPQADGSWAAPHLMPHYTRITLLVPGYLRATRPFPAVAGQDVDIGTVKLEIGGMIEGRVVDAAGRWMEGASVEIRETMLSGTLAVRLGAAATGTVSDREGVFRFTGLPPQSEWHLSASKEGYCPAMTFLKVPEEKPWTGNLVLEAATGSVFGRIEVADTLVAGVQGNSVPVRRSPNAWTAVVALDASSPGVDQLTPEVVRGNRAGGGGVRRVDIPVEKDWTFRASLKPGKYRLVFQHEQEVQIKDAEIPDGGETEVVFRMGGKGAVQGKVIGVDGRPLSAAKVELYGPVRRGVSFSFSKSLLAKTLVTDAGGEFAAEDLMPGEHMVWLPEYPQYQHHPTGGQERAAWFTAESGTRPMVTLDLSTFAGRGAVFLHVRHNGVPVEAEMRNLSRLSTRAWQRSMGFQRLADGRNLATGLEPGEYSVLATVFVLGPTNSATWETIRFTVPPGGGLVNIEHNIRTAKLAVTAELPKGSASTVRDAKVLVDRVTAPGGEMDSVVTLERTADKDGAFTWLHAPLGWYRVTLLAPGYASSVQELEVAGDTRVTLRPGPVAGRIVFTFGGLAGSGHPEVDAEFRQRAAFARVRITGTAGKSMLASGGSHVDGRELIETGTLASGDLNPGIAMVQVYHPMALEFTTSVEIPSGGEVRVQVVMKLGPKLTLVVPAADAANVVRGQPNAVFARHEDQNELAGTFHWEVQSDGSLAATAYLTGPGTIVLFTGSLSFKITPETAKLTVASGSVTTHTVRIADR